MRVSVCVRVYFLWGVTAAAMTKNKTLRSRVAMSKNGQIGEALGEREQRATSSDPAALISEYALSLFMTFNGNQEKKPPAIAYADVIVEQMQMPQMKPSREKERERE